MSTQAIIDALVCSNGYSDQTLANCIRQAVERLEELEHQQGAMLAAIQRALRIKELWAPSGNESPEHHEECRALSMMLQSFESAVANAQQSKGGRSVLAAGIKINQTCGPCAASVSVQNTIEKRLTANAKLIASAPEMFEVIERLATPGWIGEAELQMFIRECRRIVRIVNND